MKVSINWLKDLVKLNTSTKELVELLDSKIQGGTKEVTDNFIELDLKGYNRADLLSLRGVAYEVAAITDSSVNFTETSDADFIWNQQKLPETKVEVETLDLVPLYCIAKLEGLKVEASPAEWVKKLEDSGMRSVNNIADVTNLVMLEYGQPTHAFDADKVSDQTIIVRLANFGEKIVTLDNKSRELTPLDLVIADPQKAVGLAGVMGGKNSEVTDSTSTILFEAAIFDSATIRKTASRLGLPSEASKRFQHGLTKKRLLQAVNAAIKMYQDLGGKVTAISIIGDTQEKEKKITLREDHLNSLVGVEISSDFTQSSLEKLHFQVVDTQDVHLRAWEVTVPYWRLDVEIEADLVEEVARMYGYQQIPATELGGELPQKVDQKLFDFIYNLKINLVERGLDELQTYSFYSTKVLENLNINKSELIKIANPMSKETEYLRNSLTPNILEKIGDNLKNFSQVAVFEVGKIYLIKDNTPEEKYYLTAGLVDGSENPLASLYQTVNQAFSKLGITMKTGERPLQDHEKQLSHPTRFTHLLYQGQEIGFMAEVHPRISEKFGINKRVAALEIDFQQIKL